MIAPDENARKGFARQKGRTRARPATRASRRA